MATLEQAFAVLVTVLAAACVILALVVAAYWLLVQAHRLRAQLRRPPDAWWRQRGATAPTTTISARRKW
jgi:hypothetical protein